MGLSIQERLKDLRVEHGLTLEQLAEQPHLSKSALGSYEGDNFKDISHYVLIQLAKFYEVSVDYLQGVQANKHERLFIYVWYPPAGILRLAPWRSHFRRNARLSERSLKKVPSMI